MSAADHSSNLHGRRYTPDRPVKIIERRVTQFSDLYWKVYVNGVLYHVARTQGKMVRIAFKPRGQNVGHHWHGAVRDNKGRDVWTAQVDKSTGPLAMLRAAGLFRWQFEVAPEGRDEAGQPRPSGAWAEVDAASLLDAEQEE